jgi:hypothetical protein
LTAALEAPPKSPKAVLIEHVASLEALARIGDLVRAIGALQPGHPDVQLVRGMLSLCGLACPEVTEPAYFVHRLVQLGWQSVPMPLYTPQPGDLYVVTDAERKPVALGFVAKMPGQGRPREQRPDFVSVVELDVEGAHYRPRKLYAQEGAPGVDFWLRLPGG